MVLFPPSLPRSRLFPRTLALALVSLGHLSDCLVCPSVALFVLQFDTPFRAKKRIEEGRSLGDDGAALDARCSHVAQ